MARLKRLSFMGLVLVVAAAAPAAAQFGGIFGGGGGAPRPPADIPTPNRDPRLPPIEPYSGPVYDTRQPPREPPPPPLTRFPSNAPPPGYPSAALPPPVQTQPLPPPPGTAPPGASQPTLGGLPPGQRQPRAPAPANAPPPSDEVVVQPPAQKIINPTAVFAGLDKITGRIISFDVAIDETVQFGALRLTPRACYTRPPTETPNTDGFLEVDEITLQGEVKRIFTGWMFAASPGLSGVEHPIYDVWLTDCRKEGPNVAGPQASQQTAPAAPAVAPNAMPSLRR
jgi:hypothetical protein